MAHAHESNTKKIWIVLIILTLITGVEVMVRNYKARFFILSNLLGTSWLNWIFIILTLVKAYFIAWSFMHLEGEKKWFQTCDCLDAHFSNLLSCNLIIDRRRLCL